MKTLIWKDFRNCYPLVVVGIGLLFLPFLIWIGQCIYMRSQPTGVPFWELAAVTLGISAMASLIISQLTILILGAQIIAGERSMQTAEFLFYLPPSRQKIISGKLAFCALFAGLIWVAGLAALLVSLQLMPETPSDLTSTWDTLQITASVGFAMFGVAWLSSSFLPSPTFAVGISLLVTVTIYVAVVMSQVYLEVPSSEANIVSFFSGVYVVTGVAGIIGGWIYFLHRAEP